SCFEAFVNGMWYSLSCPPPCSPPAPAPGTNIPSAAQIAWNWNNVSGAIGYQWNTTNIYPGVGVNTVTSPSYTQTGLTCNTSYSLYVWAYNACGYSNVTILIQTTLPCWTCG